ncbi:MAG: 4Fe-4S binding protein [Desulforhopalus sp.]
MNGVSRGNSAPKGAKDSKAKKIFTGWRLTVLTVAFLIILINPFVNYYLQQNFIQGWYQSLGIGNLWFVSPLEGLESLLITKTFSTTSLIGMLIPLLVAIMLGRVFCSWICPISFLLELFDRLRRFVSKKRFLRNRLLLAKRVLWGTLIAELIVSMILGVPLFVFLSPPGLVGREIMMLVFFRSVALEGVLILAVVALELLTRRFFCRSFCPLGALLALLGKRRNLTVRLTEEKCTGCTLCDRACPMGLQPSGGEGVSCYCWNCGECIDHCDYGALAFHWREREHGGNQKAPPRRSEYR